MSKIKAFVGGNWKCNGTVSSVKQLAAGLQAVSADAEAVQVAVAAPSLHLQTLRGLLPAGVHLAAQDVSFRRGFGAFTGELSAEMLVDSGVDWTLTGHSERRAGFGCAGETSEVVGVKTKNAIECGLSAIACIGEQLEDREKGRTMDVCAEQLEGIKAALAVGDWKKVVIAYEPVWAIGTGVTATPSQAQETHAQIRDWLASNIAPEVADETRIIYGGSANAGNCNELFAMNDINGFLVGGASLKPEFLDIVKCAKPK